LTLSREPGLELLSEDAVLLSGVPEVVTDCTWPWALTTVVVTVPSGLVTEVVVLALEALLDPPPPPAPLAAPAPPLAGAAGAVAETDETPPLMAEIASMPLKTLLLTELSPRRQNPPGTLTKP
jgi:hypothetical protein